MGNLAEMPKRYPGEQGPPEGEKKADIFDIQTKKKLSPEEIAERERKSGAEDTGRQTQETEGAKEAHPSWPVTFDAKGNILGLPEGVGQKDVVTFKGNDGRWYAQNPSQELLEEKKMWRTDWMDVKDNMF